ncbi:protein of unknown function [Azotobacter beijerinckii]|uniref:Peptidoglycan binding-like domain-containing protein n=1 Tax=Azotobacter beijerinckii TaxID=170623 RepID=A0A1H9A2C4_9GAMM|nr:peptidoglycan-binding protein [Azotobacter beijerinckii]SEP70663.1 protein of unknown function [Azotobacter beijerinckii]
MYSLLRYGDRLPSVVAVQILLNRKMRQGAYLVVDGIYGAKTREAVHGFQLEKGYLIADGVVGQSTWRALSEGENLQVIDSVDLTQSKDMGYEDAAIRGTGGVPVVNFGMCNGVQEAMRQIQAQAGAGNVVLLRFHGHGSPGSMGVTVGTGSEISSEFGVTFLDSLARFVAPLAGIFAPFGSAELHGCRVGAGRDGQRLVSALASAWGVPVTAGVRRQLGGGLTTFRFEGPTFTGFPRGGDLKGWARSLPVPEVHGMSVSR